MGLTAGGVQTHKMGQKWFKGVDFLLDCCYNGIIPMRVTRMANYLSKSLFFVLVFGICDLSFDVFGIQVYSIP